MSRLAFVFTFLAGAFLLVAQAAPAQELHSGLSALDLFAAADRAVANGQPEDALTHYRALGRDPDIEIRTEARFRQAMLLAALGRNADAAQALRSILDEKPDAARVRLELARVLAQLGDEAAARRELRQVGAEPLPPEVAALVDQFAAALRSNRGAGGNFEVGLVPDTNINRATDARTLDTVIAPLVLDEDARAQSGLGVQLSGQLYARQEVIPDLSVVPRVSGRGSFYRQDRFNDFTVSAFAGLEWTLGRDRITPSAGRNWRWFGGSRYATTDTVALMYIHPVGHRAQLTMAGSAARARYHVNPRQSGGLFDLSITGEYALSRSAGMGVTLGATRQDARDPGYSTVSGQIRFFGWREMGSTTLFASGSLRRLEGDERLFLFADRRKEWHYQASVGGTFRSLAISGFAPLMRFGYERNSSTVGLYDYRRLTAEFGAVRVF